MIVVQLEHYASLSNQTSYFYRRTFNHQKWQNKKDFFY